MSCSKCNANCKHCYISFDGNLDGSELYDIVSKLKDKYKKEFSKYQSSFIGYRDVIKKINKIEKTTIILTTHDMSDIEQLASRIILIGKGKVLYD